MSCNSCKFLEYSNLKFHEIEIETHMEFQWEICEISAKVPCNSRRNFVEFRIKIYRILETFLGFPGATVM